MLSTPCKHIVCRNMVVQMITHGLDWELKVFLIFRQRHTVLMSSLLKTKISTFSQSLNQALKSLRSGYFFQLFFIGGEEKKCNPHLLSMGQSCQHLPYSSEAMQNHWMGIRIQFWSMYVQTSHLIGCHWCQTHALNPSDCSFNIMHITPPST